MSYLKVVWAVAIVFALISAPESPVAALGWLLGGLWVTAVLKASQWLNERDLRRRLIADAEIQHDAWKRGDDQLAFFGHYPPARTA